MIRTFSQRMEVIEGVETLPYDSQTVPDMSLSVKEILTRFRRGTLDIDSVMRPGYDDEDADLDDETLDGVDDIVDLYNIKRSNYEQVSQILRSSSDCTSGSSSGPQGDGEDPGVTIEE